MKRARSWWTAGWTIASSAASSSRIAEHAAASASRSTAPSRVRAGKARLDRLDQRAAGALQPAHLGVGVEHGNAGLGEHRRDGRLAHADRAGERERDHGREPRHKSASRSRGGSCAEQQIEAGRGLLDQHVEPVDHRQPARPRRGDQRRVGGIADHVEHPARSAGIAARSQLRQSQPGMPSGVALISASLSTGAVERRGASAEPELDRELGRGGHVARLDADRRRCRAAGARPAPRAPRRRCRTRSSCRRGARPRARDRPASRSRRRRYWRRTICRRAAAAGWRRRPRPRGRSLPRRGRARRA